MVPLRAELISRDMKRKKDNEKLKKLLDRYENKNQDPYRRQMAGSTKGEKLIDLLIRERRYSG
jgi:hypothetical protein